MFTADADAYRQRLCWRASENKLQTQNVMPNTLQNHDLAMFTADADAYRWHYVYALHILVLWITFW